MNFCGHGYMYKLIISYWIGSLLTGPCRSQLDPTNFRCNVVNFSTIVYDWDVPTDPTNQVAGYFLTSDRSDGLMTEHVLSIQLVGKYLLTYTIYGLQAAATYTTKLLSYAPSGNQTTLSLDCQTAEDKPSAGPSKVNATGISYSEIYVEWTALAKIHQLGVLNGYKVEYFAMVSDAPKTIEVSNTTLNLTLNSLNFDTKYIVSVSAFNAVGYGPQTTDLNKTLGLTTKAPMEVTRYYCYEPLPGLLVFSWEEMPCTFYVAAIGTFFITTILFLCCCCYQCCKKRKKKEDTEGAPGRSKVRNRWQMPLIIAKSFGGRVRGRRPGGGGRGTSTSRRRRSAEDEENDNSSLDSADRTGSPTPSHQSGKSDEYRKHPRKSSIISGDQDYFSQDSFDDVSDQGSILAGGAVLSGDDIRLGLRYKKRDNLYYYHDDEDPTEELHTNPPAIDSTFAPQQADDSQDGTDDGN